MNRIIKLKANLGSSLCQLHSEIELRLKDEAEYSRLQEFRNMNPTTGVPQISNTIFKSVDEIALSRPAAGAGTGRAQDREL